MFIGNGKCKRCGDNYAEIYKETEYLGYIECRCGYASNIRFGKGIYSNNPGSMFFEDDMKMLQDVLELDTTSKIIERYL